MTEIKLLSIGERVEARCNDVDPRFYSGKIVALKPNDKYDIAFDDGDDGNDVPRIRIRRPGEQEMKDLIVGDIVEARHHGGKTLRFGRVVASDSANGTHNIEYEDGEMEREVHRNLIIASSGPTDLRATGVVGETEAVDLAHSRTKSVEQHPQRQEQEPHSVELVGPWGDRATQTDINRWL
jgi:hypothetical protein